jgi:hypothetical protein
MLKFESLLAPDRFDETDGHPSRLCLTLLQSVNASLRESYAAPEFALAPAKQRAGHSNASRECAALQA